jgi:hypothetical protein
MADDAGGNQPERGSRDGPQRPAASSSAVAQAHDVIHADTFARQLPGRQAWSGTAISPSNDQSSCGMVMLTIRGVSAR